MIAWGADVPSSHKEYQNILKYYLQNLVIVLILMLQLLAILSNVIYIVGYNEFFLGKQKKRSLWQVERWRGFKESKRKR